MKLSHQFSVPTDVESAWNLLLDLPRVARCMPGATVDSVAGDAFTGSVKVKLGPMQVVYRGTGSFDRLAPEDRTAVLSVQAKESRGTGTAKATITMQLTADGTATRVGVVTDLTITGRPAQLGRGLLDDVAGQLIARFADALAGEIRGDDPAVPAADDVLDVGTIGATALLRRGWPVAAAALTMVTAGCALWVSARRRGARRCR
jgi:carbon monoxide dehydrogenase subunit G